MRLNLSVKLALVSLVLLLVLPWAGYRYVAETERFLLESQRQALLATAKAVATALHERPRLMQLAAPLRTPAGAQPAGTGGEAPVEAAVPVAVGIGSGGADSRTPQQELGQLLRGAERAELRLWVVNREMRVLATAGSLKPAAPAVPAPAWRRWLGRWLPPAGEDFDEGDDVAALGGSEITAALLGAGSSRVRDSRDDRAVIVSAAHPIWAGDNVVGVVVAEATTSPILSVRNEALERLLMLTLTVFAAVAVVLLGFATRLSARIRRLRNETEGAIDARGRIGRPLAGSSAGDEIGDLSRSFSAVLNRLAQHHSYLESLASRLSHELRTPVAIVRSSLENLRMEGIGDAQRVYLDRAEEGLTRLSRILARMAEATRLEASLATQEREPFDLAAVVRACAEGYRLAYRPQAFALSLPEHPVQVRGSADLAAQLLDKLVANAADFAVAGQPVEIGLAAGEAAGRLSVANFGPPLPAEMKGKLFESMVSLRTSARKADEPHLGLGLYIARLIAEFHGGTINAENLASGDGVVVTVDFPLVPAK